MGSWPKMMFNYPDGAAPLTSDEVKGLLQPHITTHAELNEWEQSNILSAESWAFSRKRSDHTSESFIRRVHKKMFGNTWKWAGSFRSTEKNLGLAPGCRISEGIRTLIDDVEFWFDHETYPINEIAARLHHKLVFIHPFPNGNGRHARLMANIMLFNLGASLFTWGSGDLYHTGEVRQRYIFALREADRNNFDPLLLFVRS